MKTILPLSVAVLFLSAPTYPYIKTLLPPDNAPEVPFHTPVYTNGKTLPQHIENEIILTPEDGVILVNQKVTVGKDAKLIIKPGTIIAVAEYGELRILGNIDARGTEKNQIQFISNERNETNRNWNGIIIEDTGSGRIEHTIFHHASPGISCSVPGKVATTANTYLFGNLDFWGSC